MRAKGSILVGLLWCVALVSVVVIGVLHTARIDLLVVKNYEDRIQAHYLALAGIEKAKALLYHDARQRSRSGNNHSGELFSAPHQFRDVPFGRGFFRVFRPGRSDEGGGTLFGVSDEESRLNVNYASAEELNKLRGMTPEVAAAIIDWRDEDNLVTPGGAEAEYYASLRPPCQPRNGPLQTVRELLMVRGVTPELLLGERVPGNDASSADAAASDFEAGWASLITVDSAIDNVNAAGDDRVNIQSADEASLALIHGVSTDLAKAIVAYRNPNRLQNVVDLLDVVAVQNPSQNQDRSQGNASPNPANRPPPPPNAQSANATGGAPSGPKLISETLLRQIADDVTADANRNQSGVVNINTASLEVLACLPGMDRERAQAIISHRQSNGFFPNLAWLLQVPGMSRDLVKQIAPRVCTRSETYRIVSEGKVNSTGARQRIQAIVHVGLRDITTLAYREDDL